MASGGGVGRLGYNPVRETTSALPEAIRITNPIDRDLQAAGLVIRPPG